MARWSVNNPSLLPVQVNDTTNFTGNGYQGLQGGSSTQSINVLEVYIGGQATTSSQCSLIFGRDSTAARQIGRGDHATPAFGDHEPPDARL